MDQIIKIPSPKNLDAHHWTSEEKIFKSKQKTLKKIEPLSIPLRSTLLYKLGKSFLGCFLKELNPNDFQDYINNDNKWQILNWQLERYSQEHLKIINKRNSFIDDCYGIVEKAVNGGVEIDWRLLESEIKNLRLDCIYIKQIDDGLKKFIHLKILTLCGNFIKDIPGKCLPRNLEFLELFDNLIEDLCTFVKRPPKSLRHLGMGRNRLNDDSHLYLLAESNSFSQLVSMDLSDNEFCNLELTLKSLENVGSLRSLRLEGNPCAVVSNYKTHVLECMPSLLYLDATEILDIDRISSKNNKNHCPHVMFHCFRILGLPEPPKDKKNLQTIHVEVNFPLLSKHSEATNNDSEEEIYNEKEITTNTKKSQESINIDNKKKKGTNKTKSKETKSKESKSSKSKSKKKSYYTSENEYSEATKHTKWYKSQRMAWSKIIEFDPIQIKADGIPLKNIRDTFRSIVPVRIIYLKFSLESSKSKKSPDININKATRKSRTNDLFNEGELLSPQYDDPKEVILKKITLATFYCDLKSVNWSDTTLDFYWADHPEMGDRALRIDNGSLMELEYNLDIKKTARKVPNAPEIEPKKAALPQVLTCQIGFGLNSAKTLNQMMKTEKINDKDNDKYKRDKWRNKTEFILSSLGYAIGIGNICRFPYLCYKSGGGAFLIPYLIMLFFCGVPLYFLETSIGQFSSFGCLAVFNIAPLFKGAGLSMIVVNIIVTTYFAMLYAYPLLFLYYSFDAVLPWTECGNEWNTPACIKVDNSTASENSSHVGLKSSSDEFFHNKILQISSQIEETGSIVWPLFICNAVAWLATYLCMSNGIKSVGKVVYFTTMFPFVILLVLLLRGLTLPGAMNGVWFYIWPRWDELMNFRVWCDAAVQIFYSLGPGWGGIINMASYNSFKNNNKIDSILVPLCTSATSITAGFVVFSVLGFMSHKTGIPVSSVASGGLGLAFVTYPEAIGLLPWANFWAILFFLMLFFVGMSSAFVTIETIITSICDEFPVLRRHKLAITFVTCCILWACSTIFTTNSGMYWLTLLDWYSASTSIVLISIVEVAMIGWTYGAKYFIEDIEFMIKKRVSCLWLISWKFSTPAILIAIFIITIKFNTEITYNGITYPKWTINLAWGSCYISMACIPLYMGYHLLYIENEGGDFFQRILASLCPLKDWGPADKNTKLKWIRQVKVRQVGGNFVKNKPQKQEIVQLITTV